MNPETQPNKIERETDIISGFKNLEVGNSDIEVFRNMERLLEDDGFSLSSNTETAQVLGDNSLFCRNESFSKVIDVLQGEDSVNISGNHGEANMCKMLSGDGFKTAMTEGFAGADVNNHVKAVISFEGHSLDSIDDIPKDSELWDRKPKTAQTSVTGSGVVSSDDIRMISLRFPVNFFPHKLMSDDELDLLEENQIGFIVRHYVKEKSVH